MLSRVIGFLLFVLGAIYLLVLWWSPEEGWNPLHQTMATYGDFVQSSPLNLVVHALVVAAVGAFGWSLWYRSSPEWLFLCGLLPILLSAVMMWGGIGRILSQLDPEVWPSSPTVPPMLTDLWAIIRGFHVMGGLTIVLCLMTEVVVLVRGQSAPALSARLLTPFFLFAGTMFVQAGGYDEGGSRWSYLKHAASGGPLVLLLHLLLWLGLPAFGWSLWKSPSRLEPFVFALLPLALGACITWLSLVGVAAVGFSSGLCDPIHPAERLQPILFILFFTAGMSGGLLLIAAVVNGLRQLRTAA